MITLVPNTVINFVQKTDVFTVPNDFYIPVLCCDFRRISKQRLDLYALWIAWKHYNCQQMDPFKTFLSQTRTTGASWGIWSTSALITQTQIQFFLQFSPHSANKKWLFTTSCNSPLTNATFFRIHCTDNLQFLPQLPHQPAFFLFFNFVLLHSFSNAFNVHKDNFKIPV